MRIWIDLRVVAITGQIDSNMLHKESHQNMDVVTMFKPITKWNQSIRNRDNIPEIVRRAFKIANEEKTGVTHIELPQDVAKQLIDYNADSKAWGRCSTLKSQ